MTKNAATSITLEKTSPVFCTLACLFVGFVCAALPKSSLSDQPPNIVVILADDLGCCDMALYDGWVKTPRIERMAKQGTLFTDFHTNSSVCSPTRAAFLTGRYQQRVGIVDVIVGSREPDSGINPSIPTLPRVFKNNGYTTALFGKWHCGYQDKYNPVHHGFDEFVGFLNGATDYHKHGAWRVGLEKKNVRGYSTHVITDRSVDFIKRNKNKPFFLYVSHAAVHNPYQTAEDTPDKRIKGENPNRINDKNRAKYKWMLEDLDKSVGKILDTLDELELAEKTLVVFFSDNGAVGMSPKKFRKLRGGKFSHYEGGHRVPAIAWWPGKIKAGVKSDKLIVGFDLFPTLTDIAGISKHHPDNLDGKSFKAHLLEQKDFPDRDIFFGYEPKLGTAMRRGNWKMIVKKDNVQLFNLKKDLRESTDVKARYPEITKSMKKAIDRFKTEVTPESTNTAAKPRKPHIVLILADDLGWGDVGYHGSQIKTPHIDALAKAGTRLNRFYVMPVCSPTRGALLTGRHPIRLGLQCGVVRPWAKHGLPTDERTLPQALQEVGYKTAIVGKWHLGHSQPAFLPTKRGFDLQYGHYNGALDYFTHIRNGGYDWHRNDRRNDDKGYATTLIGQEAARIIKQHDKAEPLFLYVPFNAPHTPIQAPQKYIDQYAQIKNEKRRVYAAMVACMDDAIGKIVSQLQTSGFAPENTLVIFTSDNGGIPRFGSVGKWRGQKGRLYEGGVRSPTVVVWKGQLKAGREVNEALHVVDLYPTLLRLAGAKTKQDKLLDGRDAWPTIANGKPSPHKMILLNSSPFTGAILEGDWKLVWNGQVAANQTKLPKNEQWELFNLANDPSESNNLYTRQPKIASRLKKMLEDHRRKAVKPNIPPNRIPNGFKVPKVWGEGG